MKSRNLLDLAIHFDGGGCPGKLFPSQMILWELIEFYSIDCHMHFLLIILSKKYFKILIHVLDTVFKATRIRMLVR